MNNKHFSFIIGVISAGAAWEFWTSVLTAMAVAFVGGLVTWGTREALDWLKFRLKHKHKKK